ncbi:MAG: helix-turn-helix domain-containing protein [Candidatus Lokiarchaeota archaeon]|jgi:DNA-binding transcriptional ArsR family regulator
MSKSNSKNKFSKRIEVLKLMDNITRLRIILSILIFKKISLTNLSELLGRAKSTITHHIKKLESLEVIKSTRKEARGSIDAKVYELIPGFLQNNSFGFQSVKGEIDNSFIKTVSSDLLFIKVIKLLYEQVISYYEAISNKIVKSKPKSFKDFQNSHFKLPINYDFWFLSEKTYKEYKVLYEKYRIELKKIISKENLENKDSIRPFLIINTFIPLLQIIEYDSELEEFRKFYQALD